jgi:hypothetical protein
MILDYRISILIGNYLEEVVINLNRMIPNNMTIFEKDLHPKDVIIAGLYGAISVDIPRDFIIDRMNNLN